jgi:hypothetical protein
MKGPIVVNKMSKSMAAVELPVAERRVQRRVGSVFEAMCWR